MQYFSDREMKTLEKFKQGEEIRAYRILGAHQKKKNGKQGVQFSVWAPGAQRVSVVGDFNGWDATLHYMKKEESTGIWSTFVEKLEEGEKYKYHIETKENNSSYKSDPFSFYSEKRPNTASVIWDVNQYSWQDGSWMKKRKLIRSYDKSINIYEVHLGSWDRDEENEFLKYSEIAVKLVPYLKEMGYTHVQLLPILEHPYDGSWGYQVTGFFSPTSRYGTPEEFMTLVDILHQNEIGVLLDWVPCHFCKDSHGLYHFDGVSLYEKEEKHLAENESWGTHHFDYSKPEVRSFLYSSANFWFENYHIDGLRVDAVSFMLYENYGRQKRREPLKIDEHAISFLRELNCRLFNEHKGIYMIAEESAAWPNVTKPVHEGGLGFNYKWNMGWMHDVLKFMSYEPKDRGAHKNLMTFSILYAFSENYILAFSHDEVVHGKKSLLNKMPGNYEQKFANLRLLLGYMIAHPGKKHLFMGGEIGQFIEWDENKPLDWFLLEYEKHWRLNRYVAKLNEIYRNIPALHQKDFSSDGFGWIDFKDPRDSIFSFFRRGKIKKNVLIAVANFGEKDYETYYIGVPQNGKYREVLNSDLKEYGGESENTCQIKETIDAKLHGMDYALELKLPKLSILFYEYLGKS